MYTNITFKIRFPWYLGIEFFIFFRWFFTKPNKTKPTNQQTKPNQTTNQPTKPNQTQPNPTKPNPTQPTQPTKPMPLLLSDLEAS